MRNFYTMKNLVKGLMLSAVMTLGMATASAQGTGTKDVKPATSTDFWMGETAKAGEFYLYNVGAKIFATNNTPSETDITKATLWTAKGSNNSFSFTGKNGYVFHMSSLASAGKTWTANIKNNVDATTFTLKTGKTTKKGAVYAFSKDEGWLGTSNVRYFNVDGKSYSAAKDQSDKNDWLLISDTQKKAYDEYVKLFNEAKSYTEADSKLFKSDDVEKTNAIVKQINDALKSYNYNTYKEKENGGKEKLKAAINAAKDFITTGINQINTASEVKATEIYGVNGARKSQLTKGLNIVKMSDGTVKKVLVK